MVTMEELRARHPHMKPVNSPPSLFTFNGIGLGVWGKRDWDPFTGTYVKTYCLLFLYLPVLALRAYRVADADKGWYFLGRENLSGLAKKFNILVLVAMMAIGGWLVFDNLQGSESYRYGQRVDQARSDIQQGRMEPAMKALCDVAIHFPPRNLESRQLIGEILERHLAEQPPEIAANLLQQVAEYQVRKPDDAITQLVVRQSQSLSDRLLGSHPRQAMRMLQSAAILKPDDATLQQRLEAVLESLVKAEPQDVELATQLAMEMERKGDAARCKQLLAPMIGKLGDGEGARVLGQILYGENDLDRSFPLLEAYARKHLDAMQQAEKLYETLEKKISDKWIKRLQEGKGSDSFYQRYDRADETERQRMVSEYLRPLMEQDDTLSESRQRLVKELRVVPVAIDLGTLLLLRGRQAANPAQRTQIMEQAEKTFLSVRGVAEGNEEYQLSLGQVYYWLGKPKEGAEQFDHYLQAKNRDVNSLLSLSNIVRELGSEQQARALCEEAYQKATTSVDRYNSASIRSVLYTDVDDKILWLERSDGSAPFIRASLSESRAEKALQSGDESQAANHLRQAVDLYGQMPETSVTLNNTAVALESLFSLTGDALAFASAAAKMDKAVSLNPSDTIGLHNAASILINQSVLETIAGRIDFKALRQQPNLRLLSSLYADETGRKPIWERLKSHPSFIRAVSHLERVIVMAPRSYRSYNLLGSVYRFTKDLPALRRLADQVEAADLDLTDYRKETADRVSGASLQRDIALVTSRIQIARNTVERCRKVGGPTLVCAIEILVDALDDAIMLGMKADIDEIKQLAREAQAAHPCSISSGMMQQSLMFSVCDRAARQYPEFKKMIDRSKATLNHPLLLWLAISRGDELGRLLDADSETVAARDIQVQLSKSFPGWANTQDWVGSLISYPDRAAAIAREVQANGLDHVTYRLNARLAPLTLAVAVEGYWLKRMAGDEVGAVKILKDAAGQGTPLPFDP